MLDRGHTDGAKMVTRKLRRDWRGKDQGELAAFVMDSLYAEHEDEPAKAKEVLEKTLTLHRNCRIVSNRKISPTNRG